MLYFFVVIHSAKITAKSIKSSYKSPKARKILELKAKCAKELFNSKCLFGHGVRKNYLFHHIRYKKGERVYSDFPDTFQYNAYIIPRVYKEPQRFALVCRKHHHALEKAIKWSNEKWNILCLYRIMTKQRNQK